MTEEIKNLEYNFSVFERELIEDYMDNECLYDVTPQKRTNEIVLKGDICKVTFTIHCVPDKTRTIEVEQFIKGIPSNVVNFYEAVNPLELSRIIKNKL